MAVGPAPVENEHTPAFLTVLEEAGFEPLLVANESDLDGVHRDSSRAIALLDVEAASTPEIRQCALRCAELKLPLIAIVAPDGLSDMDPKLGFDDFVLAPANPDELLARARLVVERKTGPEGEDVVRLGDVVINTANYEVSVRGRRVNLRLKEYELLLLLAANPGRVYTRGALLSQIWGYDYLGGTRTVDVHIRRLRSKIEDADDPFIETVWNVGYRFRDVKRES